MQLFDYIPAKEAVDPLLFEIIEVINQDRKIRSNWITCMYPSGPGWC